MLAVISAHLTLYLPKTERIVPFFYMGRGGAQCFFVLSGCLERYSINIIRDAKTYCAIL